VRRGGRTMEDSDCENLNGQLEPEDSRRRPALRSSHTCRLVRSWCRLDSYAETEVREGRITCKHSTEEDLGGPLKFLETATSLFNLPLPRTHSVVAPVGMTLKFFFPQNDLRRLKLPQASCAVFKTSVAYRGFSVYKSLSSS
jgi:hypothetical protein